MKKLVIMPGGFHPWHAGHTALYQAAQAAFPSADVFVAATADTSNRPFPFKIKKMLAQAAGVPANRFIQVKSPFAPKEITQMYDPADTQLIFVRSEKDRSESPKPGLIKKDGSPGYLQPYKRNGLMPMNKHGYIDYLPVAQFGPGMSSATEIRAKWAEMMPEQKAELIKVMYPAVAGNPQGINKLIEILDSVLMPAAVKETIEIIEPGSDSVDHSEQGVLAAISSSLVDVVRALKNRDYESAQALLFNSDLSERMNELIAIARNDSSPAVGNDNFAKTSDYVDEKI